MANILADRLEREARNIPAAVLVHISSGNVDKLADLWSLIAHSHANRAIALQEVIEKLTVFTNATRYLFILFISFHFKYLFYKCKI